MAAFECVSFILLADSLVLLEKRSQSKKTDPGLVTIPGGHIETGETRIQALLREVNEELSVTPTDYQYLCSLYHPTQELQLIHYFIVSSWQGDIVAHEADELQWQSLDNAQVDIAADAIALQEVVRVHHYLPDR